MKRSLLIAITVLFFLNARNTSAQTPFTTEAPSPEALLAPHPDFPIEWWYLTGIFDHQGKTPRKGFEATFFRFNVPGE